MTASAPPDFVISLKRTIVPIIVGWILAQLLRLGIDIDATFLVPFFNELVIAIYYVLARIIEQRWPGVAIVLLGSSKQPQYEVWTAK